MGAELGADIVKTNYPGDPDSFSRVVESFLVPIVVAGGPRTESDKETLEMVEGAVKADSHGVAIGRNIFQHENPKLKAQCICSIPHKGLTHQRPSIYRDSRANHLFVKSP